MDNKLRRFLLNGLSYGVVFFLLSFIISYYSFSYPLKRGVVISVLIGIAALIVNGLIQTRFTKSLKTLQAIPVSLKAFETLKLETPANHTIDEHLIPGKMFLTEKRLVFISWQQKEYSWLLNNLHSFKFYPSIFNPGGEFILEDENNNKLVFEVDEIKLWKMTLL